MTWLIVISIFFLLCVTLLFTSVRLSLNSLENIYMISIGSVFKVEIVPVENDLQVNMSILGYKKSWSAIYLMSRDTPKPKRKKKKKRRINFSQNAQLFKAILKSFKVHTLKAEVDFCSVYWNAWLYPIGPVLGTDNIQCSTNFMGRNSIVLEVENKPIWLLTQILKVKIKNS